MAKSLDSDGENQKDVADVKVNDIGWPEDELEYLGRCPVCGSESRSLQYAHLEDQLYGTPGSWSLYRCMKCRVSYLDPRPNIKTIGKAYVEYHTHGAGDQRVLSKNPLRNAKLALKNGYLNNTWNTSLQPAFPFLARIISRISPNWMELYDRHTLRNLPNPPRGELLDIGCGSGSFLKVAKAVGWSVHGIDFDERAIEAAKAEKIDVKLGGIELFDGQNELFDVITMSHVIEHVHDPKKVLKACWGLLKAGGTLWIESPNIDSWGAGVFGRDWRGLEPPRHLVLFNTRNMSELLSNVGFSKIQHAGWMAQLKPMYQASKNIRYGKAIGAENLTIFEKARIAMTDRKLKRDVNHREFFTFICTK